MNKGQITLETIIMLVVLLVLAGVLIMLILNTLRQPTEETESIKKKEFLTHCESLCRNDELSQFCSTYADGNDWNNNKAPYEIIQVGEYKWYTCEDRVYCFLVQPCEDKLGSGLNAIERCRQILCGINLEKYEDVEKATNALRRDISFSTRCTIVENPTVPPEEDWYTRVFSSGC